MNYRFTFPYGASRGDEIVSHGVDFESRVTFVAMNQTTFVFHTSSGTHWERVGERGYHGAEFHCCNILTRTEFDDGTIELKVSESIRFSPRKPSEPKPRVADDVETLTEGDL